MDFENILHAVVSLTAMGLLFGIILGIAAKVFAVETDPRIEQITQALPGANCGGCGYAGCANFADAVVRGAAPTNGCMVGGAQVAAQVAAVMGQEPLEVIPQIAVVKCQSNCDNVKQKYVYEGYDSCTAISSLSEGSKQCPYACCGMGDCVRACLFDAIHIVDGVAVVDKSKCTGCGACARACPKNIIILREASCDHEVLCSSHGRGTEVRDVCKVGCVACGICVKKCPGKALSLVDNLATIDPQKCINCGTCVEVCPRHAVHRLP